MKMLSVKHYTLDKVRLLHVLEELKANSIETGTLCVPPDSSRTRIEALMGEVFDTKDIPKDLSESLAQSSTGGILFWGPNHMYLVIPPFPLEKESASRTCEIEPLHSLLHKEFLLGIVIVRLGEYGIGVYRGDVLLSSKVGTGLVHSRHRQGGSSSRRFERHREKQMETYFSRVCQHTREQLEPYGQVLDYVLYGGTRETILGFRKRCPFLHGYENKTLDRLLNVRNPGQSGLTQGIREAWTSKIIQWTGK